MAAARLFVALKVSDSLKQQAQELPRTGLDSPRWSHPDDLHITLRFLGDVEDNRFSSIVDMFSCIHAVKFSLVVKGLAVFNRKNQRVLYAPVESARAVTNLSAEVTDRLEKIGFAFSKQPYTPHVTLARLNNAGSVEHYLKKHALRIRAEWAVDSFHLFRSADPDSRGSRYRALAAFPLSDY